MIGERIGHAPRAALAFGLALLTLLTSLHCGGDQPVDVHRSNAKALLAKGLTKDAMIEFGNALKIAPDDVMLNFELAQTLALLGEFSEARFYYDEAYRLDPTFSEAAVRRATLTTATDPAAARAMIEEVLAARPDDRWGHLGMAQLALEGGDADAALEAARRSLAADPDFEEGHVQLARVHQARIAEHFAETGAPAPEEEYEAAIQAIERAEELSPGDKPWRGALERARVQALWPGHAEEADRNFRLAFARASEAGVPLARHKAVERAAEYARRTRNSSLLTWALERRVELAPRDTQAWESLAQAVENQGGSFEEVLRRRIELHPGDAQAHVSLASFLVRTEGLDAAVAALQERIHGDPELAPPLLAALVRFQMAAARPEAAVEAARQLASRYPDSREAVLMSAWRQLHERNPRLAVEILSEHAWVPEDAEALSLLVDAQTMLGNLRGEQAALVRLLEKLDPDSTAARRVEARIAHHQGEHRRAVAVYQSLRKRKIKLPELEHVWFAQSAYEANLAPLGRSLLHELVERRDPSLTAVEELARREPDDPRERRIARKAFDLILAERPLSRRAINNSVDLELAGGDTERALARLSTAIEAGVSDAPQTADLRVRRAELLLQMGRKEEARKEAWTAFELQPRYPRALPVLVSMYADEASEEIARRGATIGGGLTPTEHAFVGRLHEIVGNERLARWSFEQALNGGVDIPALRNDLAYLLARQKTDLERALLLAQQAEQMVGNSAAVSDTIGYVHLAAGRPAEAEERFERALALAEESGDSTAQYRYHLGLAMRDAGKTNAGERMIRRALQLDPDFREAGEARLALAQIDRRRKREERQRVRERQREAAERAQAAERMKAGAPSEVDPGGETAQKGEASSAAGAGAGGP